MFRYLKWTQCEWSRIMSKKKVFIFGHGSGINRGCEAIIRTISDMIGEKFDAEITVCAVDSAYDKTIEYSNIDKFIDYPRFRTKSIQWILNKADERFISGGKISLRLRNKAIIDEIKASDICISVGGDNYCYSDPFSYYAIDHYVKKFNKPLIMYGASIEPSMMKGIKKKDLMKFDLIITRESITYEALNKFMPQGCTCLYPDPAFTLKCKEQVLPKNFEDGNIVGLNLSPLVMRYEAESGITNKAFENLIECIIKHGRQILLVPHVTQKGNSDYVTLKKIYDKYEGTGKVYLLPETLTAEEYKGYISRCRLFIGARTHSTIAAYSTSVPTLVLGYSVKSQGIDRDIYENNFGLLLPVQSLNSVNALTDKYEYIENNYDEIKKFLENKMKEYKPEAFESVNELSKFLN